MRRIVITSSTGTVQVVTTQPKKKSNPTVYSEQDWNSSSIKEVEEMCSKSGPVVAYCASKTLAEKGGFLNILSFGLPLTRFL